MRPIFLIILVLIWLIPSAFSATINAASPERSDVVAAIALAVNGDTVTVPSGTAVWTNGVAITQKAITFQGAGFYVDTASYVISNSTGIETIIIDEIPNRSTALLSANFTNTSGLLLRISGFQFKGGTTNVGANLIGTIAVVGSINLNGTNNSMWRIDHCYFNKLKGRPGIYAFSGLIDNCYFDQGGQAGIIFDGRIPNSNQKGHWSWATDVPTGTVWEGVYIENCYFTNSPLVRGCTDGFAGSRIVFRYNRTDNASVEDHGTDSTGVYRGGRWIAIYGNRLNSYITGEYASHYRSGTGVIFSNNVTGNFPGIFRGRNYRVYDSWAPYGGATGENVWDDNDPTLYDSGTHSGGNNVQLILTDSTKTWTINQWVGYALLNTATGRFGEISANTATTITVAASAFSQTLIWSTGQGYRIRKIIHVLDGVGMGKGDLLSGGGGFPPTSPTPTTWPHQVDDPVYLWSNVGKTNTSGAGKVISGRNYTNAVRIGYVPLVYPHPFRDDAPPAPTVPVVSVDSLDLDAGESGTGLGTASLIFTRSGSTESDLTINFSVGGTATSGVDFNSLGTSTTILAGSTTSTNTLVVLDDSGVEGAETVVATISANAAYIVGSPSSQTITINDDDFAIETVTVSSLDATAGEPASGDGGGSVVFTRTGSTATNLTVNFSVIGSTALAGVDYTSLGTSTVILAGKSSVTNLITILDDAIAEDTETILFRVLTNSSAYLVAETNIVTITITDDEPIITVVRTDDFITEAISGPVSTGFVFTRTGPTTSALTVNFALEGTATLGGDYTSSSSAVFPIGSATATNTVTVIDDLLLEDTESITVTVQTSADYHVGDPGDATVSLVDGEFSPILQINSRGRRFLFFP